MQGGYQTYPTRPAPDPRQVGQQLMTQPVQRPEDPAEPAPMDTSVASLSMPAPTPTGAAAVNSGMMASSINDPHLLAAIGGVLTRSENGLMLPDAPEKQLNVQQRLTQLLRLGMSPEEAHLMIRTGGA